MPAGVDAVRKISSAFEASGTDGDVDYSRHVADVLRSGLPSSGRRNSNANTTASVNLGLRFSSESSAMFALPDVSAWGIDGRDTRSDKMVQFEDACCPLAPHAGANARFTPVTSQQRIASNAEIRRPSQSL